jgi:hypothetical protein
MCLLAPGARTRTESDGVQLLYGENLRPCLVNRTGGRILDLLKTPTSAGQVAADVARLHIRVPDTEIQRDVLDFLDRLVEGSYVIVVGK